MFFFGSQCSIEMGRYHFFDFDTISMRYLENITISISIFSKLVNNEKKFQWVKHGSRPIVYSYMANIDCLMSRMVDVIILQ